MTDQEQIEAIAECLGWKWWKFTRPDGSFWTVLQKPGSEVWAATSRFGGVIVPGPEGENPDSSGMPNWLGSLDAMAEAEQEGIKNEDLADSYIRWLHTLVGSPFPYECLSLLQQRSVIRAKARQRAEALLRATGKWKD